jgi:hypothetical protein
MTTSDSGVFRKTELLESVGSVHIFLKDSAGACDKNMVAHRARRDGSVLDGGAHGGATLA